MCLRYAALPPQDRGSYHGSGGVEASSDHNIGDDARGIEVASSPRYAGGGAEADALLPEALNLLRNAVETEAKKRSKLVSSLLLRSAHVARLMHGARTTSCKSAKDRTSVFQTLEVVRLADPTRGPALLRLKAYANLRPYGQFLKQGVLKTSNWIVAARTTKALTPSGAITSTMTIMPTMTTPLAAVVEATRMTL